MNQQIFGQINFYRYSFDIENQKNIFSTTRYECFMSFYEKLIINKNIRIIFKLPYQCRVKVFKTFRK